jgi:hypothetical protein
MLGAIGCSLSGGVLAQEGRGHDHGRDREDARGGFERAAPMRLGPAPERREPGGYGYGEPPPRYVQPSPYAPPRYPAPPPRRTYENGSGWGRTREAPPGAYPGRSAPLSGVIASLRRRSPGRELDAAMDVMDGRPVYRVLWLTEHGRRMDYLVDAETGAIISER